MKSESGFSLAIASQPLACIELSHMLILALQDKNSKKKLSITNEITSQI